MNSTLIMPILVVAYISLGSLIGGLIDDFFASRKLNR